MSREPDRREPPDPLERAAHTARRRDQAGADDPVLPVSLRLAQVGVLGWTIVAPVLLGALAGHLLDRRLHTGVLFAAALVASGAGLGLWLAWRWMHSQR